MLWIEFAEPVAVLEGFYNRTLSKQVLSAWYAEVCKRGFTAQEWHQAVAAAVCRCRFLPTIDELEALLRGTPEQRATREWATREWTDVGWRAYQAIGGWAAVSQSESPEWLKKDFIAAYVVFLQEAGGVVRERKAAVELPPVAPPPAPRELVFDAAAGLYHRWSAARRFGSKRAGHYEAIAQEWGLTWQELEGRYGGL